MGLLRLVIYIGLGYALYRLLFGKGQGRRERGVADDNSVDDLLVEDPVCHLYIPQRGACALTLGGTTTYFCSPECRKKYQSEQRS